MKKQVILFLLLLPMLQVAANPLTDNIRFIEGQLDQVKELAASKGKLYLVHFTAQWCMPCQWMEKNTFNDEQLAQFANENYLAVKIDIDNPGGQAHKKEYAVTNLPTILIFNANGQLKERWETSLDAEKLLQILRKHNIPENRQASATVSYQTEILESPRPIFTTPHSLPKPDFIAQTYQPQPISTASLNYLTDTTAPAPLTTVREEFGIQVGVFSNYNNAVGEIMRLEPRLNQPIHLITSPYQGKQLFKVIVGRFTTRTHASAYLSELRRESINGIIKKLD